MPTSRFALPLALSAALLAGSCATSRTTADVTRFHLNQPIARSTVALQPADPARMPSLEFSTYAAAVADQLRAAGFTPVSDLAQAELVAVVDYGQTMREGLARSAPFSIGIGGGTFGRHVGVSGGVNVPVGKPRANRIAVNMLVLQLKRRSDNSVIWEGRAIAEAPGSSANAALATAVPKLASALLSDFPGPSGQTIRTTLR